MDAAEQHRRVLKSLRNNSRCDADGRYLRAVFKEPSRLLWRWCQGHETTPFCHPHPVYFWGAGYFHTLSFFFKSQRMYPIYTRSRRMRSVLTPQSNFWSDSGLVMTVYFNTLALPTSWTHCRSSPLVPPLWILKNMFLYKALTRPSCDHTPPHADLRVQLARSSSARRRTRVSICCRAARSPAYRWIYTLCLRVKPKAMTLRWELPVSVCLWTQVHVSH